MPPHSIVADPSSAPAPPAGGRTRRRWQVLYEQLRHGHEPCFQTDRRHGCPEFCCPWRAECGAMRAEWRR